MGYLDKAGLTWLWGKIHAKLSGKSDVGHKHSYSEITGKPAAFPPATHSHAPSAIQQDASNRFVTDAEKSAWNGKANSSHTHNASDINAGTLPIARGGTGATTAAAALTALGGASKPKPVTVTLTTAGWSNNAQTVAVSGVLADTTKQAILVTPDPGSWKDAGAALVYCSGQSAGKLTFTCDTTPTVNLHYQALIQEVQV